MLNEFTAKKLGEVIAFSRVGKETFERGRSAMTRVFGSDETERLIEENNTLAERITIIAEESGVNDTVQSKATATSEKLRAMRDLYVGDQWDNETELMEWSGFFEGAAIVHFALVLGASEKVDNAAIRHIAQDGIALHRKILTHAETMLRENGKVRA
ncbi:MAG: hypothetical protein MUD00_00400 [Candidatus Pacebacteria bacterium]|jgi:hypothetical protein|nr:hypothetical protein [Candidatus Paceibacterota bacterium]